MKLFLHALHVNELPFINGGEHVEWAPEISTWVSLGVILVSMAVATVASLIAAGKEPVVPEPETPAIPDGSGATDAEEAASVVADEHATPPTVDPRDRS